MPILRRFRGRVLRPEVDLRSAAWPGSASSADLSDAFEIFAVEFVATGSICTAFLAHEAVKHMGVRIITKAMAKHTFFFIVFSPFF